jgi:hypothetical protein
MNQDGARKVYIIILFHVIYVHISPSDRIFLSSVIRMLITRIQSHDLPPLSAQKASSVSPAHFKSALLRARRLLSQIEDQPQASSSSSKRTSPRTTTTNPGGGGPSIDPLSPFTTPRKKFKYSSGLDVSDLLKSGSASGHKHTPVTGSPLKFSSTTKEDRTGRGEEDVSRTPTKRVQYGHVRGVDLASVVSNTDTDEGSTSRKRRRDDTSAFMALRPDPSVPRTSTAVVEDMGMPEEEKEYLLSMREKRRKRPTGERVGLKRRDWTCREGVWGSGGVQKWNKVVLDKVGSFD